MYVYKFQIVCLTVFDFEFLFPDMGRFATEEIINQRQGLLTIFQYLSPADDPLAESFPVVEKRHSNVHQKDHSIVFWVSNNPAN